MTDEILKHTTEKLQQGLDYGKEIWPGRFSVRAEISYRARGGRLATMHVITFRVDMPEEDALALLEPLGLLAQSLPSTQLISQVRDTYSEAEALALVSYLNTHKGRVASLRAANIPHPMLLGASAIPALPSFRDGMVYRYHTETRYSLGFKVEAINLKTFIQLARFYRELKQEHL